MHTFQISLYKIHISRLNILGAGDRIDIVRFLLSK